MAFFTTPTSFRLNNGVASVVGRSFTARAFDGLQHPVVMSHEAHPDLGRLILLVFEAVLEVVCVSVPGYIIARQGMFNAEQQKFVANLNVVLFTPCLSELPPDPRLRLPSPFTDRYLQSSRNLPLS